MADDRDYDTIIAKLPRKDKDGNDITKDKIGKGGRHRADGTFSAHPYDIEVLKEAPEKKENMPIVPTKTGGSKHVSTKSKNTKVTKNYENLSVEEQFVYDFLQRMAWKATDSIVDFGVKKFQEWQNASKAQKNKQGKNNQKVKRSSWSTLRVDQVIKSDERVDNTDGLQKSTVESPEDFDSAFRKYKSDMTSEEAQREFLIAYILSASAAKLLNNIANSNIVYPSGQKTDGKEYLNKVCSSDALDNINKIIKDNPALLDEKIYGESGMTLSQILENILGRKLFKDKVYLPLKSDELK